jgi:hypothetical protein
MKKISAEEFDEKFDAGEDVLEYCDMKSIRKPGLEKKLVNVDFPVWMLESLDQEAHKLGITRQALIKVWIAEKLGKNM